MTLARFLALFVIPLAAATAQQSTAQQSTAPRGHDLGAVRPDAIVDLRTREGAALVGAVWRYSDARLVEAEPVRKNVETRARDIAPRVGSADFDAAPWVDLDPTRLDSERLGPGKLSFGWYRFAVTIPERVGRFDPSGSTAILEVVVDDYAEVWVDGKLPVVLGQIGGALPAGWNAPNRVVLGRDLRPGQRVEVAIFAMNGPISAPPSNFIWIRSATLDFFAAERAAPWSVVPFSIDRLDPELDAVLPTGTRLEKLAEGFQFTEGPVWIPDPGYLLFSDPNANRIYRWTPDGQVTVWRSKSGYAGLDVGEYRQPGSNGLALDHEGRVVVCEHGNRRVVRIEKNGIVTVLADRYDGKRLNSPNDLVYRRDGALYFTDPPFGLPAVHDDPRRELRPGVYCLMGQKLMRVVDDLEGPNGVALSPDERFLYVANWDVTRKVLMRYEVQADGSLAKGRVFFDLTSANGEEALDGVKVDPQGNVFLSGPIGVWILSPEGKHLGTLRCPELPANMAWGDADLRTLYLTARTGLYRLRRPASSS